MIDARHLLTALKRLRRTLDADLRAAHATGTHREAVQAEWQGAFDTGRTRETFEAFLDALEVSRGWGRGIEIKFRRLGKHRADGLFYPDRSLLVIDVGSCRSFAHEFGHVIGLGDDRDTAGNALPNSGKTLMVGGGTLPDGTRVTPTSKLTISQDLVNRVGDQVANNGDIECGKVWRGSIHGSGDNVGYCDNTTNHDGTFTVRERPRSAPSITAHIDNTAGSGCGSAGLPNRTEYDFRTEGTKTSEGFRFGPDATLLYDIRLRGHGDSIAGNGRYQEGIYRVTIRLEGTRDDA